jgi:hypothetical protein
MKHYCTSTSNLHCRIHLLPAIPLQLTMFFRMPSELDTSQSWIQFPIQIPGETPDPRPTNNHQFFPIRSQKPTLIDSFQHLIATGSGQYHPPQETAAGSPVKSNISEQNYRLFSQNNVLLQTIPSG